MNKTKLVIISILIIIILLIGAIFFKLNSKQKPDNAMISNKEPENTMMSDNKLFSGTFLDLLALGKNYQCTFEVNDEIGNNTKGKVYIADSGDKMRGDFTYTPVDTDSFDGIVVRDGKYNYVWTSMQEQGFKFAIDKENDKLFGTPTEKDKEDNKNLGFDDQDKVDFDCKNWIVDTKKFNPPEGIEFVDINAQMEELKNSMKQDTGADCSVCDQLPEGDAKNSCLTAFGC